MNICLINLAYFTRYVWQQSFAFLGAFEASSPFPRDAETTQVAEYKQSPTRRTEWIGENESNEYVRRVTTKTMGLAAIGVSLEREISKCFNLFETPRLLIVRSVDSTCPSLSSYRPSRSTFSFYRSHSSLRLLSLSNYTFLFPFKRSYSFLHFTRFSGFFLEMNKYSIISGPFLGIPVVFLILRCILFRHLFMFLRCVNPFLSESFFCFHLYSRFVLFYLSFLILLWFSTFVSLSNFSVLKIQKEKVLTTSREARFQLTSEHVYSKKIQSLIYILKILFLI